MPMPPEPLVAWTQYLVLLLTAIAGIRALFKGGTALHWKAYQLRSGVRFAETTLGLAPPTGSDTPKA